MEPYATPTAIYNYRQPYNHIEQNATIFNISKDVQSYVIVVYNDIYLYAITCNPLQSNSNMFNNMKPYATV